MAFLSAFDLVPSRAAKHEWLIANGLGGYSSSTTIGMNTRKYHGLLVAPIPSAGARFVMLSKLEEEVEIGGEKFQLSTNAYPNAIYPEGFRRQVGFEFLLHPTFAYSLSGIRLEKSVRLLHGKNTAVISYRLARAPRSAEATFSIRPLLLPRQMHSDPKTSEEKVNFLHDRFGFEISQPSQMRVCSSVGKFCAEPLFFYNMHYPIEAERGYPSYETLFSPGFFAATISPDEELHICASLEMLSPSEALGILDKQEARTAHLFGQYEEASGVQRTEWSDQLCLAADSFCLSGQSQGIIAGYPWFSEWGRDTMISLPGLLLSTGRHAFAREVLRKYASAMQDGLLPNFIGEDGAPNFDSADASLWFVNAVRIFAEETGDFLFIKDFLWKPMRSFLSSYIQGNRIVSMDGDCLLRTLSPNSTWMDAQIGGKAVTPRKGKPVEINALWYSNLVFMRQLADKFGDRRTASVISPIVESAFQSFQKFMSAEGWLFDVIEPSDPSLRPNQIFAVSLPHSPLNSVQQKHVFNIVRAELYTPLGLHTLSPRDLRFMARYTGDENQRNLAYHQGMIWPWLLGAFYDAQLKVYPGSEKQVLASLKPIAEAMSLGCVGTLPEMYEPATLKPAGAISQAWSVAEVLRIYAKVKRLLSSRSMQPISYSMPHFSLSLK